MNQPVSGFDTEQSLSNLAATLARTSRALTYMRLLRLADELQRVASELHALARSCRDSSEDPGSGSAEP
jgi:hypothetical protein